MNKLQATFDGYYPKINAVTGQVTPMFRYIVKGSKEAEEQFVTDQGKNLRRSESGDLLFFTSRPLGKSATAVRTMKGGWVLDNSELMLAAATVNQLGTGAFAQAVSQNLASSFNFGGAPAAAPAAVPAVAPTADSLTQG